MKTYKTKYGDFKSEFDLNFNYTPKLNKTLKDFNNNIVLYKIYLDIEKSFKEYEKRVEENFIISEKNNGKKNK